MTWDGKERRNVTNEDHDILIEIKSDVKHLVGTLAAHIISDDIQMKDIRKDVQFQQKITYCAIGIVAFLEFVSRFM